MEITHISDSVPQGSQIITLLQHRLEMQALRDQHQAEITALQSRLENHITALETLQLEKEDQRAHLVKAQADRDAAFQTAATVQTLLATRQSTLETLRVERTDLRTRLAAAEAAALDHSIPERAELEALKLSNMALETGKVKLEQRIQSQAKELEYIRGMYQDSSNRATELAGTVSDLETQLALATTKASGETAKAQLASKSSLNRRLVQEKERLETLLRDREGVLARKDEEIARMKEVQRGRMGTRGSSVPGSPARLGSPMRFAVAGGNGHGHGPGVGVGAGVGSGVGVGVGNRQASMSPAPGSVKRVHPLGRG